ncbi:MAG TPA: FtsX-like permease family protein [Vicinamibacterales bacterium]|nr:FtsX-like permease family protein [Vicinamibacterales bacterium]
MESWLADVRFAVRRLARRPVATLVAILVLSAGIGSVSTVYLLFRAGADDLPPVPGVDRLARIWIIDQAQPEARIPPAPAERRAWIDAPPAGVRVADSVDAEVGLEPGARAIRAQYVSSNFFAVLGVTPELGRGFAPDERAVVVSRRLWELLAPESRRLGAVLAVDGEQRVLTGVMARSFWFPVAGTDAWLNGASAGREGFPYVIARLDSGVSAARAADALGPHVRHLRGSHAAARVRPLAADAAVRARTFLLMLAGPALLVLLAVCANVAALLLADVTRRQQELAVRAAIGAGRWRLARDVIADAIVLAAAGGAVAVAAAFWSARGLRAAFAQVSPSFAERIPGFDAAWPIALGAVVVAVIGVGSAPALHASRARIAGMLNNRPALRLLRPGHYGTADLLLVLQIAVASGLVLWTATLSSVFNRVLAAPSHLPGERLWSMDVRAAAGQRALGAEVPGLLLAEARSEPAIEAAALSERRGGRRTWSARSANGAGVTCSASLERVTPDYFRTFNFPQRGRFPGAGAVVLNEGAAARCGNPEGMRELGPAGLATSRVTGVVNDLSLLSGEVAWARRGPATVYAALEAPSGRELTIVVRTRSREEAGIRRLRERLATQFFALRFGEPLSMAGEMERQSRGVILIGKLLAMLAALCLLLGIVGLHAAISQALSARMREIGVRLALGATRRDVLSLTVGHHAVPAMLGILLGAGATIGGLAMLSTDDAGMIRQVAALTATSPAWWAGLLLVLLASTLLSAGAPARRALGLSPADILRAET